MPLKELEKKLDQAIEDYRSGSVFTVDTFDQSHYSEKEMKETIEQMSRETYYALNDFKKSIVDFLKESERK